MLLQLLRIMLLLRLVLLLVLLLPELYNLVRITHCLQHAETSTSSNVGGKTDLNSGSDCALQRKQTTAQKRIRRGTECYRGSSVGESLQMLLADMHTVRKDGFASNKAIVLVNAEIIPSIEK
jgi:hypothetical protein